MFLATGANIMPSLLWPWAIGVPLGFGFAIWASSPRRIARLKRLKGKRGRFVCNVLEGVGILRQMAAEPRKWAPALLGTALYWVADMAAFYGALRAFGLQPGLGKVIIAYATGYAATRRSLPARRRRDHRVPDDLRALLGAAPAGARRSRRWSPTAPSTCCWRRRRR